MRAGLDSLKMSMNYPDADQFESIARVKPALYPSIEGRLRAERLNETLLASLGHTRVHPRADAGGVQVTLVAGARNQRYLHLDQARL